MSNDLLAQLLSGEKLVWEGRPWPGYIVRPADALLIPFSLLWGGFALFWNILVWSTKTPLFFRLFGLPFLLVGAYVILGRFFVDAYFRRKMVYGVTEKRILILRKGMFSSLKSLDIKRLPSIELQQRPDGSGTISFGPPLGLSTANGFGSWSPAFNATPQFIRIANVQVVYEIIQSLADI